MADADGPTIYIVDDDPQIVAALSRLIRTGGFHVEAYSHVQEFLDNYRPEIAGCVILDVVMDDWNGLDVQTRLNAKGCGRPVIFISGQSELITSVQAMKGGAVDFLSKPVTADDLFQAIYIALERDRKMRGEFEEATATRQRLARLTCREYEVLVRVAAGRVNKQIAFELGIVEKTAKVHRARVMTKMGARNVAELVRMVDHIGVMSSTGQRGARNGEDRSRPLSLK